MSADTAREQTAPVVYCIENLINGKRYVGLTDNAQKRWAGHLYALRRDKHPNARLQLDWNRLGEGAFEFKIIQDSRYYRLDGRAETDQIQKARKSAGAYNYLMPSGPKTMVTANIPIPLLNRLNEHVEDGSRSAWIVAAILDALEAEDCMREGEEKLDRERTNGETR